MLLTLALRPVGAAAAELLEALCAGAAEAEADAVGAAGVGVLCAAACVEDGRRPLAMA